MLGATLGGLAGTLIGFSMRGMEFVLTAMFTVIFTDNWLRERSHVSSVAGLIITGLCLVMFGADRFIIPSMAAILIFLTLMRHRLDKQHGA